ncbi:hypothetical protein CY34DRAFT_110582 [Suillus luteus UH-Slu-Lm8-n1]|uniref:Uncharacterized protein n=1 Tax=Suillus luteus UH-Slu-Lm8-n1 TaxID=930992 RepID=A0A0D0A5X8_9AGAM|nr:hypothetical protein CY34DRAFT_110582 [Suillus luteus UH-Slu-Lm8-n1]
MTCMTTCISLELFDYSSDRTSVSQLSSLLGYKFLDAYIGLTANQKLQTELYILSHLLKDRVRPEDLWRLVGERCIEAKQEETLGRHQTICHGGYRGRHAAVERFLLEERKKWNGAYSNTAVGHFSNSCPSTFSHRGWSASVILMHISPSLPLLSTWVTIETQEAFYEAFRMELRMQVELMRKSVATRRSNAYLRNLGLDLLILQAKMRHAKAENQLYTLAIQNTSESSSSDRSSRTSWDQNISQPLSPEELNCHDEDIDDAMTDCDDDGMNDCDKYDTDNNNTDNDDTQCTFRARGDGHHGSLDTSNYGLVLLS